MVECRAMNPDHGDTLLAFPCNFPIKAMGRPPGFAELVLAIVSRHAPDTDVSRLSVRESRHGRYLAVTVTVNATSRAQLDDIYRELSAHERVLMAL